MVYFIKLIYNCWLAPQKIKLNMTSIRLTRIILMNSLIMIKVLNLIIIYHEMYTLTHINVKNIIFTFYNIFMF